MTYPIPNYTRVWVRGRIIDLGKAALQEDNYGLALPVTFSPSPKVLLNAGTGQIISTASFKITPAAQDGYFAIQLPATDDPDINPTNFTYSVKEPTGRSYNIVVPAATPLLDSPGDPLHGQPVLDLITIVPSPPAGAGSVQLLTGLPGRGIASIDNVAGDLVVTYTDSTTHNLGPVPAGAFNLSDAVDVTTTGAASNSLLAVDSVTGSDVTGWKVIDTAEITPADIGAQPAGNYATLVGGTVPDAQIPSDITRDSELALKAPLASPAFTGTPTGITKSHVGLGSVDNTSDTNKPASSAQKSMFADDIDLPGILGLQVRGWSGGGTVANVSGTVYAYRIRPRRDYTITNVWFNVATASGTDDPLEICIYSGDCTTKLATTGSVSGRLNLVGDKIVPLSVTLQAGVSYYVAFVAPSTATVRVAQFNSSSVTAAFGSTLSTLLMAAKTAQTIPLPAPLTGLSQTGTVPLLCLREV